MTPLTEIHPGPGQLDGFSMDRPTDPPPRRDGFPECARGMFDSRRQNKACFCSPADLTNARLNERARNLAPTENNNNKTMWRGVKAENDHLSFLSLCVSLYRFQHVENMALHGAEEQFSTRSLPVWNEFLRFFLPLLYLSDIVNRRKKMGTTSVHSKTKRASQNKAPWLRD